KRNFSAKAVTGTDISIQDIYVAESDYEKAYDLCVGIGAIKLEGEETILGEEEAAAVEEFEDMPSGKRTAVRIVSAILFVLLAAMVIFGVDAITGWIKSLF
ncbi:MAG: hypothetical protein IIY79_04010, partial [Ruminococcus sp.]|nr:hypothetical protein [Ruminococcus sp.]